MGTEGQSPAAGTRLGRSVQTTGALARSLPRHREHHQTNRLRDVILGGQDATGLQYKRNRYYDPVAGRFTQEDPIGLAGGMNLYGFGSGDPVTYSDHVFGSFWVVS